MLLSLFLTFAKIGLFTFGGGGYAMISLIENVCVNRKHWITHEDMMNITVIAESTPGPIAINCATFVGYRQKGLAGALAATIGVALPSFVIIYLISMFLDSFLEIAWIASAFKGIRIAVGLLITDVGAKKALPCTVLAVSFAVMLLVSFTSLQFSTISLMLAAAMVSLAVFLLREAALRERR